MASKSMELAQECKRQYENCLYTSTSQMIWLKCLRTVKVILSIAPILLGTVGSWKVLTLANGTFPSTFASISAFLAGLIGSIAAALKLDSRIEEFKASSGELTNLRDRFRQAALISSKKPFDEFETEFKTLRDRLDKVRSESHTAPEICFKLAQRKIKAGDYSFDIDGTL